MYSYNYENTDLQTMIDAATLRNISATWENLEEVKDAKRRLDEAMNNKEKQSQKNNFTFIINDKVTYHSIEDFRSLDARKLFVRLTAQQKELERMETKLSQMRDQYANGNAATKQKLMPPILKLEKQIPVQRTGNEDLTIQIRNLEITKINK